MTRLEMVKEFHEAVGGAPNVMTQWAMIAEEFEELKAEVYYNDGIDRIKACKEIEDLIYVLVGLADVLGFDEEGAFAEVHRSNMSKFIGGVIRREDGKVMKGPHYSPANMEAFV